MREIARKLCIKGKTGSKDAREVKYRHHQAYNKICVYSAALSGARNTTDLSAVSARP